VSLDLSNPQSWNKYSYAFNRPVALIDDDGDWPTWYHHVIIQDTFGNLGSHTVAVLDAASDWVDSIQAGNQAPEQSFMHSMRDGAHQQSIEAAEQQSDNYVDSELGAAVNAQLQFEQAGGQGLSDDALTHFGHALHTVTDATSPEHTGFQPGYCLYCPSAYEHHRREEGDASSGLDTDVHARYMAHLAAANLWQRYQRELEDAKKRRERAERKKQKRKRKKEKPK